MLIIQQDVLAHLNWAILGVTLIAGWWLTRKDSFVSRVLRIVVSLVLLSQVCKGLGNGHEFHPGDGFENKTIFVMGGMQALNSTQDLCTTIC